jgi:OCT family organic cation transporter-like MFS transporter 4/5
LVNWVLASECISINYHGIASMLFGLWWVVGYCAVAGIVYVLPHWQHFMIATSIPSVLCAIIFWFTIPESFQYLIEKGKKNEAQEWIENIENSNDRLHCDIDFLIANVQTEDETTEIQTETSFKASLEFLLNHKKYLWYLFASTILWIIDMLLYNSMSLVSSGLSGDGYLNYVYSGLVEIPAYVFTPFVMDRFVNTFKLLDSF